MKIRNIIIIALACLLSGCLSESVDESKVFILSDNEGAYTCSLGSTMASKEFTSYEEAESYCNKWKENYDASEKHFNKDWRSASR